MTSPVYCPNCGAGLPAGARFCPNCGAAIDAEPARPIHRTPAEPRARRPWWIIGVPLAILAIVLGAWAILAGMPFGNREEQVQTLTQAPSDTIGESSQSSTTVSQIGETTMPPPAQQPQPAPTVTTAPPVAQMPPTTTISNPPMASSSSTTNGREISADDATSRLREYLAANNPYPNSNGCVGLSNAEYRNRGYTFEVHDTCAPDAPLLGRWRVDSVTRDVYQQNDDGRYIRP